MFYVFKSNTSIMNSGKVLLGLLAGIAAGTLIGLLLAPDKGSVTRNKIKKKADEYADDLNERFNEFVDIISEKVDYLKDEIENATAKVKDDPK